MIKAYIHEFIATGKELKQLISWKVVTGPWQKSLALVWLICALAALLVEVSIPGTFFFLAFCCMFLGLAAASWLGMSVLGHAATAIISFTLGLLVLKKWAYSWHFSRADESGSNTNTDALCKQTGIVIKPFKPEEIGLVKVSQETWSARGLGDQAFTPGQKVKIIKVIGNKVLVDKA